MQPGPAPSPAQQPVGGELSCASHPGWALLDQIVGREFYAILSLIATGLLSSSLRGVSEPHSVIVP